MRFDNIFSLFGTLRKRSPKASVSKEQLQMRFNSEIIRVARLILADADKGFVRFALNGDQSQIQCDFQWFADITDGGRTDLVIIIRHCLLGALNILLGANGQKGMTEDTPLPVFLMIDGEPRMQYSFFGKTGVRCTQYDPDLADAIAALEEVEKDRKINE